MQSSRTCVSVDLDGVDHYHSIHGLPLDVDPRARDAVLERCLPRFLEVFAEHRVHATFFVIGRDLEDNVARAGRGAQVLRTALEKGHELANHSYAHRYDLLRMHPRAIEEDLMACDRMLRELGAAPRGFRAPGYTHDDALLRIVSALGYRYDASALPSPGYYAAKLAVMGWMRLRGLRSASLARGGAAFFGPRAPHRRTPPGIWQIPISVTPRLRVPLIGTSLLASPKWFFDTLMRSVSTLPFFHLELHGLDLADASDGYSPTLIGLQPELRTPLATKRARLEAILQARGGSKTLAAYVEELESGAS